MFKHLQPRVYEMERLAVLGDDDSAASAVVICDDSAGVDAGVEYDQVGPDGHGAGKHDGIAIFDRAIGDDGGDVASDKLHGLGDWGEQVHPAGDLLYVAPIVERGVF